MGEANSHQDGRVTAALARFRQAGGILRTRDAIRASIHPRTLYALRDEGLIEELSRGLYRLVESTPLDNPDLVTVSLKVPRGVVCLISALAWHELTTQIPHEVHLAIPRGSEAPRLQYPPVHIYRFGEASYATGIDRHQIDGVEVPIYSREKTIADCFKFRNQIGMDVVLEAVRFYRQQGGVDITALMEAARVCRVRRVMTPYLESLL
jgi:predicted transcriptional regulator of viral defense system